MEAIAKQIVNRRLQAFKELMKTETVTGILNQMVIDRVLNENDRIAINSKHDPAEELFIYLEKAKKEGKIILLDYRWQLLPWIEIELIIATDNGIHRYVHKE